MVGKGGWSRHFDDPMPLPRGRQFVTQQDAGDPHHESADLYGVPTTEE
jgi:hypothetical protein